MKTLGSDADWVIHDCNDDCENHFGSGIAAADHHHYEHHYDSGIAAADHHHCEHHCDSGIAGADDHHGFRCIHGLVYECHFDRDGNYHSTLKQ